MNVIDIIGAVNDRATYIAGAAGAGIATAGALTVWAARARRALPQDKRDVRKEDRLTFLAAAIAAGVSAQGMWRFFDDVLHFPIELRIVSFAFLEIAMFVCALRARRNVQNPKVARAGVDGIAVWVIAALSAVFSALDARSEAEALFRLAVPLLAAWLWERGMSIERRRVRGGKTIHWRITPERVLVRLGLAEATDRSAFEVDAHRRLTAVAKAAMRIRTLKAADTGKWWRQKRALIRLHKAMERAVAHAGLATDQDRQQALLAQLGALYHAATLVELDPRAPWTGTAPELPADEVPAVEPPAIPEPAPPVVTTPWGGLAIGSPSGPLTAPGDNTANEARQLAGEPAGQVAPEDTRPGANTNDASSAKNTPPTGDSANSNWRQNESASGGNSAPPVGDSADDNCRQDGTTPSASTTPPVAASTTTEVAPAPRQKRSRSGGKSRKRGTRRSMDQWVELAGPVFHDEFKRLRRQPTGEEFAEAIKKARLGEVSASTAKNIRTAILDRTPVPALD